MKPLPHLLVLMAMVLALLKASANGGAEYVENLGQWDQHIHFRTEFSGGVLWAEESALTFLLLADHAVDFNHGEVNDNNAHLPKGHAYKIHFIAGKAATAEGLQPNDHHYNYYMGNDPARWAEGVKPFEKAKLLSMYEGIDVLLYSKGASLKYDAKIAPHADPNQFQLRYEGIDHLELREGALVLQTALGEVIENKPFAYQLIDGKLLEVECAYVLEGDVLRFELGEYDPNFALTIDPEISFASYIGAPASNFGFTATDDLDGNLIGGAAVFQAGYPTTLGAIQTTFDNVQNGYCDIAISKFSANGNQLMYSTYMGGYGLEMPHSIISDANGDYIVLGTTGSDDFPTTTGAYQNNFGGGAYFDFASVFVNASHLSGCDVFLAKFSGDDSGLLASTYVGGSGNEGLNVTDKLSYNYGDLFRGEVIVDDANRVYVATSNMGGGFPMAGNSFQTNNAGGSDGIIFRMSADLSTLEWSSYLGGSNDDAAYSLQLDDLNRIVACGGTKSADFPLTSNSVYDNTFNGDVDAFVVKFNPDGSDITASTFFGTATYDQAYFVQLDLDNNVHIYGQSEGNLPISANTYGVANSGQFIAKFNPQLATLQWQTTIGSGDGAIDISPTAFLVSDCNQIYFTGWGGTTNQFNSQYATSSSTNDLPITPNAYQSTTDGSDFYLCVLSVDAEELVYATYFGGSTSTEHVDGGTAKFDKDGSVYQAVCAGCGGNSDFPTTPGAWSDTNPSSNCNLGVFKFDLGKIEADINIDGPSTICEGTPAQFINNTLGGSAYEWSFGDGNLSSEEVPAHTYNVNGDFSIQLIAFDPNECLESDTAYLNITILPGVSPSVLEVDPICEGQSTTLFATGSENAFWLADPTLDNPNSFSPIVSPEVPTSYFFVDENDCETETIEVFVDFIVPQFSISPPQSICLGESIALEVGPGSDFEWSPADFIDNPSSSNIIATPTESSTFSVGFTSVEGCALEAQVEVEVIDDFPGGNVYDPVNLCIGGNVQISAVDGFSWEWSPAESLSNPNIQNPIASPSESTTYFVLVSNLCGTGTDQLTVNVIEPSAAAGDDGVVCFGEGWPVWASGGEFYSWSPAVFVDDPNSPNPSLFPVDDQLFTVTVSDENGCTAQAEVFVEVLPLPDVEAGPNIAANWLDEVSLSGSASGEYWWTPAELLSCSDCLTPQSTLDNEQWFVLHQLDENGCVGVDSVFVELYFPIYLPNSFTPNNDGINDVFKAYGDQLHDFKLEVRNRWGEVVYLSVDPSAHWDGSMQGGDHYCQTDTYIWTVWFGTLKGVRKLRGHVNLLR